MFQVRIHGRGGQGVVTAAEMLSIAGFLEDRHTQAFPSFGSERMGAPVMAFCRFDDKPIRLREPVMAPDALIIQDTTLLHQVSLFEGVSDSGYVLINSRRSTADLGLDVEGQPLFRPPGHVVQVAAQGQKEALVLQEPVGFVAQQHAGIDITGSGAHDQSFEGRHAHAGLDAASVFDCANAAAAAQVTADDA